VQPQGFMETGVRYTQVTDIMTLSPWDAGHKHCIQMMFADGDSVLLQVSRNLLFILFLLFYTVRCMIRSSVFVISICECKRDIGQNLISK